jgi:transmembrane sensor
MQQKDIKAILEKVQSGNYSPEDEAIAKYWLHQLKLDEQNDFTESDLDDVSEEMWLNITEKQQTSKVKRIWPRIAAAASILVILSAGVYFALRRSQQTEQFALTQDIPPGHNVATLTLANGQKIILNKGLKGQLATQGTTVIQADDNNISYNAGAKSNQISYNTLTTARGEQSPYPLILADGTKVWLNAASSITFPTAFPGKERIVKITGEAYFEVVHNDKHPFKVESAGQVTEDIGTHFNIMSYTDEPNAKVTLAEGAVRVNGQLLQPGEQTINTNGNIKVAKINVGFELAWKDGYFRFTGASITTVMRELARWYNIDVVYEGKVTDEVFYGRVARKRNISEVLRILERSNKVNFKIEGRRVTVLSKI